MSIIGVVITIAIINPYLIIPAVILVAIGVPLRNVYLRTVRDVKRLDSTSKLANTYNTLTMLILILAQSPIYSHITMSFDGLTTVRAFGLESKLEAQYMRYMDDAIACRFISIMLRRSIGFYLDCFALIYVCSVSILVVLVPNGWLNGLKISRFN